MAFKDARQMFKAERLTLDAFAEKVKILKKYVKINIRHRDFAVDFNINGKDAGVVTIKNAYLCVFDAEVALYCLDSGVFKVYYACLEDYDGRHMYDYNSARFQSKSGADCARIFSKYYKIERINEKGTAPISASQILYLNDKAVNKEFKNARSYDCNSAFSAAQRTNFISFEDLGAGMVTENQVGFLNPNSEEDDLLTGAEKKEFLPVRTGYADHRFEKREVPEGVIKFVDTYYDKKKKAISREEKQDAKNILNFTIGTMQNKNWAYRALIIGNSNEKIARLRDEINAKYDNAVLFCNTDSICVDMDKCPNGCPELDSLLGDGLGQFKIEHEGRLYVSEHAYQWENDIPKWRGVRKARFERFEVRFGHPFYLGSAEDNKLMDTIPTDETRWKLDEKTLKFVKYAEWERPVIEDEFEMAGIEEM